MMLGWETEMKPVAEYVASLPEAEIHSIISSYEQFEKDGYIGDEPIRLHTRAFMESRGLEDHYVSMWMTQVAMECYRYFYHRSC